MNLAIIIVLAGSVVLGYWTGLVVQVVRLVSMLLSTTVAFLYGAIAARALAGNTAPAPFGLLHFLCPAAIFFGCLIGCCVLAHLLSGLFKTTELGLGDRVSGALVGFVKGVVLVGFVAAVSVLQVAEGSPWRRRVSASPLARGAAVCAYVVVWAMPEHMQQQAPGQGQLDWPVVSSAGRPSTQSTEATDEQPSGPQ